MNITHISFSDLNGGAARAAYRLHKALRESGVNSKMLVEIAKSDDWTVNCPHSSLSRLINTMRVPIVSLTKKIYKSKSPILHSPAILPSSWLQRINNSDADIINLHWITGEMLPIADIGRIRKPIVWTLHDMWAFCGAEHLAWDERWRFGYRKDNRPPHESGFDINRWTWERKRKYWKAPMNIVAPSRWIGDCAMKSTLMRNWPVSIIPNCIATDIWKPIDKKISRELLGLPDFVPLIAFGSTGASDSHRKGFDLLIDALQHLGQSSLNFELVIFGQSEPQDIPNFGFPLHYIQHCFDDLTMRAIYSSVDVLAVPSRQDNLPNTAVEAQACGTPVVSFDIGGLPDIVEHKQTGYIAKAFDVLDLARGLRWVLTQELRQKSRDQAVAKFSNRVISEKYIELYRKIINMHKLGNT